MMITRWNLAILIWAIYRLPGSWLPSGWFHQWGHSARVAALIFFGTVLLIHSIIIVLKISYINMLYIIYILLFYYSSVAPIVLYHTIMVVIVLATLTSDTNLSFHQGFTRRPWTATAWCAATPCWRRPNTRRSTRTWRGWSTCLGGCDRGW